jgi:GTPase Era involved in 16S rRNA processing
VTLGIKTTGAVQIVMYDLPGVIAREQVKHRNIERVASAWATAAHCDVLLFVVDTYSEVRRRIILATRASRHTARYSAHL